VDEGAVVEREKGGERERGERQRQREGEKYYSALKKKEIPPSAATRMKWEGVA
jgi:hypothetical protein